MAASASSQHRCVFVGNIPYDATEEQLMQICEEVGPVVSFRLVLDRETGKPKGYGFCEYKDEETALSARRNLQGYEINGRQLRVDFAENDKNADRNREQGRGGPGLSSSTGGSSLHQPIGLPLAANAASIMASALGGSQSANIQSNLQGQSVVRNDPLTHYLSKISRHQLNEIMSEMKALTTQNKPLALQLLQSSPQLSKALFQAQIMLGMVAPQMMQMANPRQSSNSVPQLPSHVALASLVNSAKPHENMVSQNPGSDQFAQPLQQTHIQPKYQLPQQGQLLQGTIPNKCGDATLPSLWSQSPGNLPIRPSLPTYKGMMSQSQPSLLQQPSIQPAGANLVHQPQLTHSNVTLQQPTMPQPPSQLSTEAELALLEQVRSLTPEQLSSLPLEQQQQILQLQKMLSVNR